MEKLARIEKFAELKRQLSENTEAVHKEACSVFSDGFPTGRLIEVAGPGKTEFLTFFLKEHPDFSVAWFEKELTINPFALWQKGVSVENILFIETHDLNWSVQQVLQSQLFKVIVLSQTYFVERDLRRFQLFVEKSNSFLFLLSQDLQQSWVPSLQILLRKNQEPFVFRKRGYA